MRLRGLVSGLKHKTAVVTGASRGIGRSIALECDKWLVTHPIYTASKYSMSMVTLGHCDTLRANTVWPKKLIATAATNMLEERTSVPAFTRGQPPARFARLIKRVVCSDVSGLSCLDDDIELVTDDGVDDVFIDFADFTRPPP